jgi:hypothetical protein
MNKTLKLNIILFIIGFIGVLSFLFTDIDIAEFVPEAAGKFSPIALKFLSLINPTIFLIVAVTTGGFMAPMTGLRSPLTEGIISKEPIGSILKEQLKWGIPLGLISGLLIISYTYLMIPVLPQAYIDLLDKLPISPVTRFLYGGITEEILLRWGFMTLLVFMIWKIFFKKKENPGYDIYWTAIIISAIVFGAGHLPIAFILVKDTGIMFLSFVIIANAFFGIAAGWLYWKKGLESAMMAHMAAHCILIIPVH